MHRNHPQKLRANRKKRAYNNVFSIVFCGFCCASFPAWLGAQPIEGLVLDPQGSPLPYASVVASGCPDNTVLAYGLSTETGAYALDIKPHRCDSIVLTARALGFKTAVFAWPAAAVPARQDFVLERTVLQEVLIKGKVPPVLLRNDTTEFHVAAFSDSTEFSVEDLLKKLPGIRVSEQGRVTLNGKEVERVLVEGDDLFSQNYHIATRNIRANMVAKVQAIEGYQDNPLMKGIQNSERLVLNLKIKAEKKRANSGSITPGLGHGGAAKGFCHANFFSLTRRDKTIVIGNANNTGYNALGQVQALARGDIFDRNRQNLQGSPLRASALVQGPALQTLGLPSEFGQTNRSGLLSTAYILPLGTRTKIRSSAWVGIESLEQQLGQRTRYLLEVGGFDLLEDHKTLIKSNLRNAQLEFEHLGKTLRQSLRGFVQLSGGPERSDLALQRSTTATGSDRIQQTLNSDLLQSLASIEYTFKPKPHLALQGLAKQAFFRADQTLQANYRFYPAFFGLQDSSLEQLRQQMRQSQALGMVAARVLGKSRALNWETEAGIQWETGALASGMTLRNASGQAQQSSEGFRNDFRMAAPAVYSRSAAQRTWGAWSAHAGLSLTVAPIRLVDKNSERARATFVNVEPRLRLGHQFDEKHHCTVGYGFTRQTPHFPDYVPAFWFGDYQSIQRGLPQAAVMPGHGGQIGMFYNDRAKQRSWNLTAGIQQRRNALGAQFLIDPFLSVMERYRPINSAMYHLGGNWERYFPGLTSRFALSANLQELRQENRVNSTLPRGLASATMSLQLDYGSAFDGWLNLFLTHFINHSNTRNSQGQFQEKLTALNATTTAQVVVKPSKRFYAKLFFYRVSTRTGASPPNTVYAAKGSCALTLPKWRSQLYLEGTNLLGSRHFQQADADTFVQNTTTLSAVRPFFVFKWDINF
jgi:hypothetical protein